MPNIQEYSAQGEITPSDKGIQTAELAGRRVGQFYHQIGDSVKSVGDAIEQHESLVEVSHIARNMSDGEAGLADAWSKITSDPTLNNRPDLASTFMKEQVEPFITKMQGLAGTRAGQEYALQAGDRMRQQFWRETQGDQAHINGRVVDENSQRVGNNAAVSVARDPSQMNYDAQVKNIKDTADIMVSQMRMPPGEADRSAEWHDEYIRTHMHDLTVARYKSMADAIATEVEQTGDPSKSQTYADAKRIFDSDMEGNNWVKGEEWTTLGKELDQAPEEGMRRFDAHDAQQRRGQDEAIGTALGQVDSSLYKPNGAGGVTIAGSPDALVALDRISRMPGAGRHVGEIDSLRQLLRTATQDQIAGKETTTDQGTYVKLSSMIGSNTNPLTTAEVDQARVDHRLSDPDWSFLRTSAVDSKQQAPKATHAFAELNQWLERIKPVIDKSDPLGGTIDQGGAEQFSYFSWDAQHKVRQAIASGEDPEKAVQRLTDPRNPNGFYHFIPQYQTTTKQGLSRIQQIVTGGQVPAPLPGGGKPGTAPPVKPGESPSDYLKRTQQ